MTSVKFFYPSPLSKAHNLPSYRPPFGYLPPFRRHLRWPELMPCQQTVCGGRVQVHPTTDTPGRTRSAEGNNIARLAHTHSASPLLLPPPPQLRRLSERRPARRWADQSPLYKAVSLTAHQNNKQDVGTGRFMGEGYIHAYAGLHGR